MISLQKNRNHLRCTTNQHGTFALCVKCRHMVNLDAFDPEIADPNTDVSGIDWFDKFRVYQPIMLKALKTTVGDLCKVWNLKSEQIFKAMEEERLLEDSVGDWYINAKPWEPQSICYDCRHPKSETECDDPISEYLKLLEAAL